MSIFEIYKPRRKNIETTVGHDAVAAALQELEDLRVRTVDVLQTAPDLLGGNESADVRLDYSIAAGKVAEERVKKIEGLTPLAAFGQVLTALDEERAAWGIEGTRAHSAERESRDLQALEIWRREATRASSLPEGVAIVTAHLVQAELDWYQG